MRRGVLILAGVLACANFSSADEEERKRVQPLNDMNAAYLMQGKYPVGTRGVVSHGTYRPYITRNTKFAVREVGRDGIELFVPGTFNALVLIDLPNEGVAVGDKLDVGSFVFEYAGEGKLRYLGGILDEDKTRWKDEFEEYYLIKRSDDELVSEVLEIYRKEISKPNIDELNAVLETELKRLFGPTDQLRVQDDSVLLVKKLEKKSQAFRLFIHVKSKKSSNVAYEESYKNKVYDYWLQFSFREVGESEVQIELIHPRDEDFFKSNYLDLGALRYIAYQYHRSLGKPQRSVDDILEQKRLSQLKMRGWTSDAGTTVEAKLLSQDGDNVVLLTKDGREIEVPISRLSDRDKRYLKTMADKE